MRARILFLLLVFIGASITIKAAQSNLQSRAERTNYTETSRYSDVMEFIAQMQRLSPAVRLETFAVTNEGRRLPLVVLSKPVINSPAEALASGKPVVFVMANIHAGEVEGKEAMQHLMRDVVTGSLNSLLDRIILLVAPIYNADGNEKISINNRTAQNGPLGGVGVRENAQSLDLNRDFMKLESPEARGLVENVFNRWDPHVTIDLHTTNGSLHGYALTYSPSLNPNTDQRIVAFARNKLLPAVTKTLRSEHKYQTYYYGNFSDPQNPFRELPADRSQEPKAWATFDHRPRFGNNYTGLRNRIAILSEAYSYLDFRSRVDVTDKFVRAILDYVVQQAAEVVNLIREADRFASTNGATQGNEQGFGIGFQLKPSPKPAEILVGSVTRSIDPRTNRPRLEATKEARPVKMTEYGEFQPVRRVRPPVAYIFKPEQKEVAKLLKAHGIVVETITADETFDVEQYTVKQVTRAARAFQGHREMKAVAVIGDAQEKFPAGTFIVSMKQPKAALIFYLLEPESDDGVVNWNYFDKELEQAEKAQAIYPIYRLKAATGAPREIVRD